MKLTSPKLATEDNIRHTEERSRDTQVDKRWMEPQSDETKGHSNVPEFVQKLGDLENAKKLIFYVF